MKGTFIAATGILLLVGAGIAVADSIGTKAVKPVSAAVTVSSAVQKKLRTCTSPDGTLTESRVEAHGSASSSEPSLTGPTRVILSGVVDTGRNAGTFGGTLRIEIPSARDTEGKLTTVYANGKLHGLLQGTAPRPFQRLVADVSADFNPSSGQLSNLKIGQTDGGGAAVLVQPGTCKTVPAVTQRVSVTGVVSAISHDAITVATVTCFFPRDGKPLAGSQAVRTGDVVEMTCAMKDDRLVVEKLKLVR
jgi:hypothetical protein